MRRLRAILPVLLLVLATLALRSPAGAVEPSEMLDDPALETRARALSAEIRCLVCQNQSIDESNAQIAQDLRRLVRERVAAGQSNQEIKDYLTARYGDFVLLEPPMKPGTYVLWFAPAGLAALGAAGVALYFRRRRRETTTIAPAAESLSDAERARLDALLVEAEDGDTPREDTAPKGDPIRS